MSLPNGRRHFIVSGFVAIGCCTLGFGSQASAVEVPNLEQTLRAGLKPRTPQQREFLALVLLRVKQGKLPLELVQKVFLWARDEDQYDAFRYFEFGLRRLAARDGILL